MKKQVSSLKRENEVLKKDYLISKKGLELFSSITILIERYNFGLNYICRVLNVNKSSYIYWKSIGSKVRNATILFYCLIIQIYADSNGIYVSPKIIAILNKNGLICPKSKVARAMNLLGIRSIVAKKFPHRKSTMTETEKSLIINLIKDLNVVRINLVWTTDITYIKTINE